MQHFRTIARWGISLITFLGIGPIVAEIIKRWMNRNGYLEHPEEGIAWIVSIFATASTLPWFYPALGLATGITLGLWVDPWLRYFESSQKERMEDLGKALAKMALVVSQSQAGFRSVWPGNVKNLRGELSSLFLRLAKFSIYTPSNRIFDDPNGASVMIEYLDFVAAYLKQGELAAAKKQALEIKGRVDV